MPIVARKPPCPIFRRGALIIFAVLAFCGYAHGQEAVRASLAGNIAFQNLIQEVKGPSAGNARYNFRIGQSEWYLAARFSTEYNSNINLSQSNPLPDLILHPAIDLSVRWQVTQRNYLAAKMSFEYYKYLSNPTYDQFSLGIDPDTILEYNFFIKDFRIRIYDRPSTQRNAANDSTLSNVQNYSLFTNIGGISVTWDLNKVILMAGVERNDQMTLNANFGGLNSYGYTEYVTASVKVNPTLFVGARLSSSQTYYQDSVLNNNQNTTAGLFVQGRLSTYTAFRIEGGLQQITFSPTGTTPSDAAVVLANPDGQTNLVQNSGGGDFIGPYATFNLDNRLNRYFTHGLSLSAEATPGTTSDYVYIYSVAYNLNWTMNRKVNVSFSPFYQYGIQSGTDNSQPYSYYGFRLRFDYFIVKNINIYTEIGATIRATDLEDNSYNQYRALFGFQYAF